MEMLRNMGMIDRSVRALVGLALVIIGVISGLWWLYIIAAIMLLTSAVGICPLYLPFRIRTFMKKERDSMDKKCC
ncbi:MAG: DUF2892 domain-containing protein [Thermoplasmatota archaeon]